MHVNETAVGIGVQLFRLSKYRSGFRKLFKASRVTKSSVHVMCDIIRHEISSFSKSMDNESNNLSSVLNFSWYRIISATFVTATVTKKKHSKKSATKKKVKKTISLFSIIGSILYIFAEKALSQLSVFLVKCCEIN